MRTRLALAVMLSWFAAATLVGPSSVAAAPAPHGRHYVDPRYADHAAVAVEGTLVATEIDRFGTSPASSTAYAVRIDDGSLVPVSLTSDLPANGRFSGELAITGRASKVLKAKGLMPSAGRTVDEATTAGSIALEAAAEGATLPVAEATVTAPAAAAAPTPQAHRAYVAKLTDQGSVDGTDTEIEAKVNSMLAYWQTESAGAITTFARVGSIKSFDSTANISTTDGCGLKNPYAIWPQAASLFQDVDFTEAGNHLIVLVGDECGKAGPVGVAQVGDSIASGGQSILTFDDTVKQVGAHELGHNFGLQHANLNTCVPDGPCEYYDLYSPMSLAVSGSDFQPPALGSLDRHQLQVTDDVATVSLPPATLTTTTQVHLAPRSGTTGTRGLLVTDPVTGTRYSVDLRTRQGRDANAFYGSDFFLEGTPDYRTGVVIERAATTAAGDEPGRTYLMTHDDAGVTVGAYEEGETFQPRPRFTITIGDLTATAADVTVTLSHPTINGPVKVGRTVTADAGAWPGGATPSYQWNLGGQPIDGATDQTYTPTTSGRNLTVTVSSPSGPKETSSGTVVAPGTLTTAQPTIGGTAKVGRTLRAYHGTWKPTPASWSYQWYVNGSRITGATRSYYVVSRARIGKRITVKVTARRASYSTASRTSARTSIVTR